MGTYNEKLARGQIQFELERDEIMIVFTGSWNAKWARIEVNNNSPMLAYHKRESKYNTITYRHYIGLSMFGSHGSNGKYPLTKAWKSIVGEWSKTDETMKYLIDNKFVSFDINPKFPTITGKGVAMLENIHDDLATRDLRYRGRYSDYVKDLKSDEIELDDFIKIRGE